MSTRPRPRPSRVGSDLDDLLTGWLLGAVALLGAAGLGLWAAGQLAALLVHGDWPDVPPAAAFGIATGLPAHLTDPAQAWPVTARGQVPGPVVLYGVLLVLMVAFVTSGLFAVSAWRHHHAGDARLERDRSPLWARPTQIRALLVRHPEPGRVVLGRLARRSRWLVAAEARRSVLVVAPTQAGKTSRIVVPTVLRWTGPMLVTSVKADVLRLTLAERRRRGPAYVFDPTGATTSGGAGHGINPGDGEGIDPGNSDGIDVAIRAAAVKWSPLLACTSYPDAERTAAWLIEAGGDPRGENATFWESLAAKLLAPLLYAAAGTGRSLRHLAAWVDRRETTEITEALSSLGDLDALDAWAASCAREERQRESVYATTEVILRAFASPSARAATDITDDDRTAGRVLDVGRLLTEHATLYLVAPAHEQGRLRPLFESLVQAVLRAAQDTYARTGRPLDPALMVMLDEAANIAPLRQLATYAATGAGQGIQICSVWQDLAQVEALYGRRAATVINGHTARVFLAGSADLTTLDATSRMIGDHPTDRRSRSTGPDGGRSVSEHTADTRLAPVEYLRQLPPDTAVVLYGRAPVIRLTTTPWYADPALRRLVDPIAAAESDGTASTSTRSLRRRHVRRSEGATRRPQGDGYPQIHNQPTAAVTAASGSSPESPAVAREQTSEPALPATEEWSTVVNHVATSELTRRLAAAESPLDVVALAWQAADHGETVALALSRTGSTDDIPAYLTAADAFASLRTDLDDHVHGAQATPVPALDNSQQSPDELAMAETALAELARTLIVALSDTARACGDPDLARACSQGALSAADAAEATTRTSTP